MDKSQSPSRLFSHDPKKPFPSTVVTMTPTKKNTFSIESLGMASNIIGLDSWLEDTLERKRKRRDEGILAKDTISLVVHFVYILTKVKKHKTLSILGTNLKIGHLTMEIAKLNKGGRIKDMTNDDSTLHSIDLGETKDDTPIALWRSSNELIEDS